MSDDEDPEVRAAMQSLGVVGLPTVVVFVLYSGLVALDLLVP
jgi:hypothetical protein